jgi:hypothetical protein
MRRLISCRCGQWEFDVAGHYARPDVFQLTVRTGVQPMITAQEIGSPKNTQFREVTLAKPAIGRTEY